MTIKVKDYKGNIFTTDASQPCHIWDMRFTLDRVCICVILDCNTVNEKKHMLYISPDPDDPTEEFLSDIAEEYRAEFIFDNGRET